MAITIVYLDEHKDAEETKQMLEGEGCKVLLLAGDVGDDKFCKNIVERTNQSFGRIGMYVS